MQDDRPSPLHGAGSGAANPAEASPACDDAPISLVPITVWRLDDSAGDPSVDDRDASFGSRLAQRLVDIYTDPHDVVADFDGDPHLHHAAEAAARGYRAITDPAQLTGEDAPRTGITLVVWRWPRPATWPTRPTTLFAACHLIMARDGCVIAAVRSADPGQPRATHAEHLARLLPAAENAGFRHVLQIVAVGGCDTGDRFLYYATEEEAQRAAAEPDSGQRVCHIDLLAFTPVGRNG